MSVCVLDELISWSNVVCLCVWMLTRLSEIATAAHRVGTCSFASDTDAPTNIFTPFDLLLNVTVRGPNVNFIFG